ncbi:hypothetical protein TUZN_0903 [Thermoproteus uzoniensis 768-20]|uniref:Uncharacterized protein n=1 Tax=Thermoproteus uzoniensis (strain 768-20) TaxID=999630 RepID=F2L5L6_THEU7|nr:hypothetical protein [Thermoproteus uzoniensis]AEA12387.1 hypothetical protein TUZN_0903 [Thermoproteus uzoniensis 768-20]
MGGVSEIVASALLLAITVALLAFLVAVFYNIYTQQQGELALAQASRYCQVRIVAVFNSSGAASIWVYNFGQTSCAFTAAYALDLSGGVSAAAQISASVAPGALAAINTTLPYGYPGYRLATNNGQTVDWWGQ